MVQGKMHHSLSQFYRKEEPFRVLLRELKEVRMRMGWGRNAEDDDGGGVRDKMHDG